MGWDEEGTALPWAPRELRQQSGEGGWGQESLGTLYLLLPLFNPKGMERLSEPCK